MGLLADSLDKADLAHAARPAPKSAPAQMRYLVKQTGSTKATAVLLGVSQRTVERYVKAQLHQPRRDLAARMTDEVHRRWQPRVRKRARRHAATLGGIVIETRARFGYTAAPGTTDDPRQRLITQALPPAYAARLFEAHATGASEQQLRGIVAEGLQEVYFKDSGRRAQGLLVELTDLDYAETSY